MGAGRAVTVLGIESSCDETAAALVRRDADGRARVLAERLLSQIEEHRPYEGVVPEIAARSHLEHLDPLVREVIDEAGLGFDSVDAIAATGGPGLIGGVMVGVTLAKAIAAVHAKPFVAVNHLEGHALSARLVEPVAFPYLLLLVSGGHCQLLVVRGVGDYRQLGTTIDDAAGEAFDKVAKLLGLGYPGGPAVEAAAKEATAPERFPLPRPMKGRAGCDFSFSGLKTAVRHAVVGLGDHPTRADAADIAAAFQLAVADAIEDRCRRALERLDEEGEAVSAFVVAGGVAANTLLRARMEALAADAGLAFVAPPLRYCTDNAAMIAWAGAERLARGATDPLDFAPRPRWPLASLTPVAGPDPVDRVLVVGGGAWGTALAAVAARAGRSATLWAREAEVVEDVNGRHENRSFLPGVPLDPAIVADGDLARAARGAEAVLMVTPAQHMRAVLAQLGPALSSDVPLVIASKGIEQETGLLLSEVVAETGAFGRVAVLSGPTFAAEVARGLPTAVTLAAADRDLAAALAQVIGGPMFRPYLSTDVIGAEIGGAIKNVIAIACGIVHGRKLGENARAALITRGLAEIGRLGAAKGASPKTLMGLSGLGDLTLTCNSVQSRNMSLGVALGEGQSLDAVLGARNSVAEGVWTARSVVALARRLRVDMPICGAVERILHEGADIADEIEGLLSRPFRGE